MSTNGHMPPGYYVVRKESGRKVLYSPHKVPRAEGGVYVPGTEQRPVASWITPIPNAKIHHIASLDRDVMERRPGAPMALMELHGVFNG